MWKLKSKLALPIAQLMIAGALLRRGYVAYLPKSFDTFYVPTGRLICDGINAPARLLTNFVEGLLPGQWRWSFTGSRGEIFLFFVFIAVLWYLVGAELDLHSQPKAGKEHRATSAGLFFNSFLALLGILLAVSSVINFGHVRDLGRWNNFVGNIVEGVLYWVWSLVLVMFSGVNLVNGFRNRRAVQTL
jgi:hypothetical protein